MTEALIASSLALLFVAIFTMIELAKRKLGWSAEITRRLAHITSGLCALLNYFLVSHLTFIVLVLLSLALILLSWRFKIFTSIHNVKRKTYGEIFLALGILASFAISLGKPEIFIPSLLVIAFADSFAGLTSDFFKQPRKMIRGSLVFLITTFSILCFSQLPIAQVIAVSLVLTLVERYSPLGSDNLTVPTAAAALLLLL